MGANKAITSTKTTCTEKESEKAAVKIKALTSNSVVNPRRPRQGRALLYGRHQRIRLPPRPRRRQREHALALRPPTRPGDVQCPDEADEERQGEELDECEGVAVCGGEGGGRRGRERRGRFCHHCECAYDGRVLGMGGRGREGGMVLWVCVFCFHLTRQKSVVVVRCCSLLLSGVHRVVVVVVAG